MSELIHKSASELAELIASKSVSSVEVTGAFFDRSEALNPKTNSYLYLNRETAMNAAKAAEEVARITRIRFRAGRDNALQLLEDTVHAP